MAMDKPKGLGTLIESALSTVGVTEERVTKWLGRPCGCSERKRKLNELSTWAIGLIRGTTTKEDAGKALDEIVPNELPPPPAIPVAPPVEDVEEEAMRIMNEIEAKQNI